MDYRAKAPPPPLDALVERLWYCADAPAHRHERILPSGTVELVFDLARDEIRIHDPTEPGAFRRYSGAVVSGTYARSFVVEARQHASMLGVHFRPGGAFPFLGVSLREIADAHVDLEALWGCDAVELRERLVAASSLGARFGLVEAALLRRIRHGRSRHAATRTALRAFDAIEPVRVRDLATHVGLSPRHFIEVFESQVGLTPKRYARLRRFDRARRRIAALDGAPRWPTLALECGYFDQPHMIRDFAEFSGMSPTQYLRRRSGATMIDHVPEPR